jgi:hypothetical protein
MVMVGIQTTEVDAKLAPVNVRTINVCILIDLQRMNNI